MEGSEREESRTPKSFTNAANEGVMVEPLKFIESIIAMVRKPLVVSTNHSFHQTFPVSKEQRSREST